ncbi:DUF4229 domain-containing protein [Micromonospora craterilacus]|uniref:DUF4229 domain-containing protein n=1 Tax=Micromonospora craterilacus TaxID=1655439 RepID=A0A2W2E7I4_9ACTN|nr:DUF4229 domain-containing protein [Micromonospora craterilacus]PZG12629.1 DUF4229 domain-containing protein [Micromonospora craterilacus]
MSAAVKYTLGRIGLFAAVVAALWPVNMNIFLKLMVALLFSAALSFFLLKGWRDEMAEEMASAAERRRSEKERLRAALAGDDQAGPDAPADGASEAAGDQPGTASDQGRGPAA